MIFEISLFVMGLLATISAVNFIGRTTPSLTCRLGMSEYLSGTVISSFIITLPAMIIMIFSNIYQMPSLGIATIITYGVSLIGFVLGSLLIFSKKSIRITDHRSTTFAWGSAILLLVVSVDKVIDRIDAGFLLCIFAIYLIYVVYNIKKTRKYVCMNVKPFNTIIYPLALVSLTLCMFAILVSTSWIASILKLAPAFIGLFIVGFALGMPLVVTFRQVFKNYELMYDHIVGNFVIIMTLIPGVAALISPMPLALGGDVGVIPLIFLNILVLSLSLITRSTRVIGKRTGVFLVSLFIVYTIMIIVHLTL